MRSLRGRTVALETEVKAVREELEAAREQRSTIELSLVQLRSDLKHLAEECQRELISPSIRWLRRTARN